MTKKTSSKSSTSSSSSDKPISPYRKFYTRRAAELKASDPDGKFRDMINEEWKTAKENPNHK